MKMIDGYFAVEATHHGDDSDAFLAWLKAENFVGDRSIDGALDVFPDEEGRLAGGFREYLSFRDKSEAEAFERHWSHSLTKTRAYLDWLEANKDRCDEFRARMDFKAEKIIQEHIARTTPNWCEGDIVVCRKSCSRMTEKGIEMFRWCGDHSEELPALTIQSNYLFAFRFTNDRDRMAFYCCWGEDLEEVR